MSQPVSNIGKQNNLQKIDRNPENNIDILTKTSQSVFDSLNQDLSNLNTQFTEINTNLFSENNQQYKQQFIIKLFSTDGMYADFIKKVQSNDINQLKEALQIVNNSFDELQKIKDTISGQDINQYNVFLQALTKYSQIINKKLSILQKRQLLQKATTHFKALDNVQLIQNMPAINQFIKLLSNPENFESFLTNIISNDLNISLPENEQAENDSSSSTNRTVIRQQTSQEKLNQEALDNIFKQIDFDDANINDLCKAYIIALLKENEEYFKTIQGPDKKLTVQDINKIGNDAFNEFMSVYQSNQSGAPQKVLIYDTKTKKKIPVDRDKLFIKPIQYNSNPNNNQIIFEEQSQQNQELTISQIALNNSQSDLNSLNLQDNVSTNIDSQSLYNASNTTLQTMITEKVDTYNADTNNTNRQLSKDQDIYDFIPKTDSTDYNDYVINKKTDYIVSKHTLTGQANGTLSKDFDEKSSETWNKNYSKGLILGPVTKDPNSTSDNINLITSSQKSDIIKKRYNVKQTLNEQNQKASIIQKLQKLAQMFIDADESINNLDVTGVNTSNSNIQAATETQTEDSSQLIQQANIAEATKQQVIPQAIHQTTKLNSTPESSSVNTQVASNTGSTSSSNDLQSQNIPANNMMLQYLKQLIQIQKSHQIQQVVVPAKENGQHTTLIR